MSMFYRRAISRTSWERRKAQREAELTHLQKRGVRLLIVGSLILLAVGLTLIAREGPLAHRCIKVVDAVDLTAPCRPQGPKPTSANRTTSKVHCGGAGSEITLAPAIEATTSTPGSKGVCCCREDGEQSARSNVAMRHLW
jgi:hypothetical protein